MRYEHLTLDISTATCHELVLAVDGRIDLRPPHEQTTKELVNFRNELVARLQRRDVDPHCPKNVPTEDWLNT